MISNTVIINEEKILNAITVFLGFMVFVFLEVLIEDVIEKFEYKEVLRFISMYLFFSALYMTRVVYLKNNVLIKGIKIAGFTIKESEIPTTTIKAIEIIQNIEKYFVIVAVQHNQKTTELKKIANKNPALKELDLIKSYFNLN